MKKHNLLASALLAAFALTACNQNAGPSSKSAPAAPSATGTDYPRKPVTLIVPFSAGGPTDTVARLLAQSMSATLKQQVIVENVTGAGGTMGAQRVARADNDGYTLLIHHIGMASAPALYKNLTYTPTADFSPIGLVADVPMTIIGKKDLPANDLQGLIGYLKANKDSVNYAHAGVGSSSHLCGMLLSSTIDTKLTGVGYKGTGPAMNDLLGGQVDLMCDQTTNTTGHIKSGAVKAYAVTTSERLAALPDLPTAREAGLADFQISAWHALWAPKGTDPAIVAKLTEAARTALQDTQVKTRLADLGAVPVPAERVAPHDLQSHLESETQKWGKLIQEAGVYAE